MFLLTTMGKNDIIKGKVRSLNSVSRGRGEMISFQIYNTVFTPPAQPSGEQPKKAVRDPKIIEYKKE